MTHPGNRLPGCVFVLFLLFGLAGTGLTAAFMVWPVVWARLAYAETSCVVLDKKLEETRDSEGQPSYKALVHIEYTVAGVPHRAWTSDAIGIATNVRSEHESFLGQFQKGQRYPCWYDPSRPDRAVLSLRFSWWGLFVLLPLVFVGIGVGGLIANQRSPATRPMISDPALRAARWGPVARFLRVFLGGFVVSAIVSFGLVFGCIRWGAPFWLIPLLFFAPFIAYMVVVGVAGTRLAARMKRTMPTPERAAAEMATLHDQDEKPGAEAGEAWPTVPDLKRPPRDGQLLAYQLDSSSSPFGCLLGAFAIAAFWNGIVSVFVVLVVSDFVAGKPNWGLALFLVPFVLIGLVLLGVVLVAAWHLVVSLLTGRVRVEIAAYRLRPGESYRFLVEQSGLLGLRQVQLTLVCSESATYTHGTSTQTESKEVCRAKVAGPAAGLEGGLRGSLTVPDEAMHSFEAPHNKITWQLEVSGRAGGFLPYDAVYPVIVLPAGEGDGA
jgi:hypothetical protein